MLALTALLSFGCAQDKQSNNQPEGEPQPTQYQQIAVGGGSALVVSLNRKEKSVELGLPYGLDGQFNLNLYDQQGNQVNDAPIRLSGTTRASVTLNGHYQRKDQLFARVTEADGSQSKAFSLFAPNPNATGMNAQTTEDAAMDEQEQGALVMVLTDEELAKLDAAAAAGDNGTPTDANGDPVSGAAGGEATSTDATSTPDTTGVDTAADTTTTTGTNTDSTTDPTATAADPTTQTGDATATEPAASGSAKSADSFAYGDAGPSNAVINSAPGAVIGGSACTALMRKTLYMYYIGSVEHNCPNFLKFNTTIKSYSYSRNQCNESMALAKIASFAEGRWGNNATAIARSAGANTAQQLAYDNTERTGEECTGSIKKIALHSWVRPNGTRVFVKSVDQTSSNADTVNCQDFLFVHYGFPKYSSMSTGPDALYSKHICEAPAHLVFFK